MRQIIAKYRFRIAFTLSLGLHLAAFYLCPHFGSPEADNSGLQAYEISISHDGDFTTTTDDTTEEAESQAAYVDEASFKTVANKQIVTQDAADTTATTPPKKSKKRSTSATKSTGTATNASTSVGECEGPAFLSLQQATLLKPLPLPPYPALARSRGFEGSVTVQVLVSGTGQIKDIKIVKQTGSMLFVDAVLSTIKRKWQGVFAPHKRAGFYVDGWVEVTIPFVLK